MANQVLTNVENNFTKGLVTEFTGLNFPENAATDTDNCIYTLVGDVIRREGIDYEVNGSLKAISGSGLAVSSYKWNDVAGDGETQVVVYQVGSNLYFYKSSAATSAAPLSSQFIQSINLIGFASNFDNTLECTYADGNGYLFVFHPTCNPLYVQYTGILSANQIQISIRDFTGLAEINTPGGPSTRPTTLYSEHDYNLLNQGWSQGAPWQGRATDAVLFRLGSAQFTIGSGFTIVNGQTVNIYNVGVIFATSVVLPFPVPDSTLVMSGTVTSYVGSVLTVTINSVLPELLAAGGGYNNWVINPASAGYINSWFSSIGNYPSDADVWWNYRNSSDVFDPTLVGNITLNSGYAPRGHYILNAFNQLRSVASGLSGITDTITPKRPRIGTWFQGRVWYSGVDDQQVATGNANQYVWSSNIYFSQIVTSTSDFGSCYQTNDPTSENLFDLLSSDGGVITIPEAGVIYKLFPLMNALLVFAANGVWYVSGSQGIGFAANDYSVVKLSAVRSISSTSFVDINGLPMFWNEEGIYSVEPAKQGQGLLNSPLHVNPLEVNPLTVGTILTFYNNIPLQSKKYARASYDPIGYTVQWLYKSVIETSVTDRYEYNSVLNLNTYNKAFYPYSLTIGSNIPNINSIIYVSSPGGLNTPDSAIKYLVSNNGNYTFADEHDNTYVDWATSGTSSNFDSYFVTGYKLHGQGQRWFQMPYIYVYSRLEGPVSYKIQGIWDYASTRNSGRWSVAQLININNPNFGFMARRHRIRGQGLVLQIKVSSTDGMPFDIMGWSSYETQNTGV